MSPVQSSKVTAKPTAPAKLSAELRALARNHEQRRLENVAKNLSFQSVMNNLGWVKPPLGVKDPRPFVEVGASLPTKVRQDGLVLAPTSPGLVRVWGRDLTNYVPVASPQQYYQFRGLFEETTAVPRSFRLADWFGQSGLRPTLKSLTEQMLDIEMRVDKSPVVNRDAARLMYEKFRVAAVNAHHESMVRIIEALRGPTTPQTPVLEQALNVVITYHETAEGYMAWTVTDAGLNNFDRSF